MLPLLKEKETLVHIVHKEDCKYDVSDVVLYKRGKELVLHRIIEKNGSDYKILGDNQYIPEIVTEEQVLGVMTTFINNGKEVTREDAEYRKYVNKIMNMSMAKRKLLSHIRRII